MPISPCSRHRCQPQAISDTVLWNGSITWCCPPGHWAWSRPACCPPWCSMSASLVCPTPPQQTACSQKAQASQPGWTAMPAMASSTSHTGEAGAQLLVVVFIGPVHSTHAVAQWYLLYSLACNRPLQVRSLALCSCLTALAAAHADEGMSFKCLGIMDALLLSVPWQHCTMH